MNFEKGTDWSKWQNPGNAVKAKAAGITTLIARACYGNSKDTYFETLAADVLAAGLKLGAYGFATWHYYAANSGSTDSARAMMRQQTARLIELSQAAGVNSWVALDLECEAGHAVGLEKAAFTKLVNEACDLIRAAGLTPCVYCSASWLGSRLDPDGLQAKLWTAYYNKYGTARTFASENGELPSTGTYGKIMQAHRANMIAWQFTSEAPGAQFGAGSKTVDLDFIYAQPLMDSTDPADTGATTDAGKQLTIKSGSWCIRASAATGARVIGYASGGETYIVQAESNGWYNIGAGWIGPGAVGGLKDLTAYAHTYYVQNLDAMTAGDYTTICAEYDRLGIAYKTTITT